MRLEKIIIIVGPTASGKSELAVKLAKLLKGEVVSADSRQIYQGLNIGSGKVPGRWRRSGSSSVFLYKNVVHHCIDTINPKKQVSVAQFQKAANKAVKNIIRRGHVPIICGGTAHWVDGLVYNQKFPRVKPDLKLRTQLERKTTAQLYSQLKKLDPDRAKNIDAKNPRRLIRALEIVLTTGQVVPQLKQKTQYDALWLGIKVDQETLAKKIDKRLKQWLKQGLLHEIEILHKQGISWQQIEQFGLDYKFGTLYLQDQISYDDMVTKSATSIKQYAKRQMTWWKRNKEIRWVQPTKTLTLAKRFIKKE